MRPRHLTFWLSLALLLFVGCSEAKEGFEEGLAGAKTKEVSRADLGDKWPLTVETGTLKCEPDDSGQLQIVTFENEGKVYAVNGTAKSRKAGEDIDSIWADNPSIPGTKVDIGPLIQLGRDLCA